MTEPGEILATLKVDTDLVLRFFAVFSRFEYSLKRCGYLRAGEKAEPDWDKYANSIRGSFDLVEDAEFKTAVSFLLREPPKTQIISGKDLTWRDTVQRDGEHDERYVLRLVNTVRNNLFHGGKYPYPLGRVPDVGRNRRLLEASISVLLHCLEISTSVRDVFKVAA